MDKALSTTSKDWVAQDPQRHVSTLHSPCGAIEVHRVDKTEPQPQPTHLSSLPQEWLWVGWWGLFGGHTTLPSKPQKQGAWPLGQTLAICPVSDTSPQPSASQE